MFVVQSLPAARVSRQRGTENRIIHASPTMQYIRFVANTVDLLRRHISLLLFGAAR
jgi:hypothetical protein